jgi:hypothetical protein
MTIMDDYEDKIRAALLDQKCSVEKCRDLVNGYATIHILKVIDVTKKEKTPTVERTILLKKTLMQIDKEVAELKLGSPEKVLIEYQMSLNDKSRCCSQQIAMHYVKPDIPVGGLTSDNQFVHFVGPTLKNKIVFQKDLDHGHFMEKYASKYTANNNHAKDNLKYWLKIHDCEKFLKGVPKKNWDDLADAFMQIFGWLYFATDRP